MHTHNFFRENVTTITNKSISNCYYKSIPYNMNEQNKQEVEKSVSLLAEYQEAQTALQKLSQEKLSIEENLVAQSQAMGEHLKSIQTKVQVLSSENKLLKLEVTAGSQNNNVSFTNHDFRPSTSNENDVTESLKASRNNFAAQSDVLRLQSLAKDRKITDLESRIRAEMQDRRLRNEEIDLLLQRIDQLDKECVSRQNDVLMVEHLQQALESANTEIEKNKEHSLLEFTKLTEEHKARINELERELSSTIITQKTASNEIIDQQEKIKSLVSEKNQLLARVEAVQVEHKEMVSSHKQDLEKLRSESEIKLKRALETELKSRQAEQTLASLQSQTNHAALTAVLRQEFQQEVREIESRSEARLQTTIVSKDNALSNAISTLQESLRYAQEQKTSIAMQEMEDQLKKDNDAKVSLFCTLILVLNFAVNSMTFYLILLLNKA